MTTKRKIIAGFVLMIVLLGGVAFLGYSSLGKASDGFDKYRRIARLDVECSDVVSAVNAATFQIFEFLDNPDHTEAIKNAHASVAEAIASIKNADELVEESGRQAIIDALSADIQTFDKTIDVIANSVATANRQYRGPVQDSARQLMADMNNMGRGLYNTGNIDALIIVADAWDNLASARSSLGRFAESRDMEEGKKSHEYLDIMGKELERLAPALQSREGRALYTSLTQTREKMLAALTEMEELFASANENITALLAETQTLRNTILALNADVTTSRNELGLEILESNGNAQKYMMGVSLGGVILGILFASFIIIGIISVLNKLAVFAGSIARGDFAQKLDISEGGEIGAMANAMREIPVVLNKVTSGANNLANAILSGGFRKRLDTHEYSGSYAEIAQSVNSVSDAYTGVIDNLPVPVLAFDSNHAALFANEKAQQVFDGNEQPADGGEDPKKALGMQAMQTKSAQFVETVTTARGQRMIAAMTAMPLFNMDKTVVGYFGIINDLTEIRGQQNTMMEVAAQASQISDRVAAASEQLAAQVEQISRGAELQRERVESTASAMTEMNSTVLEVAQNAGQASEQSEDTRNKAEDGAQLVNRVVKAINTVNTVAVGLQGNMQELGDQAENIGGIMNVISDIADQTNLLALNAAIEAARAGEYGRGFAVVADEVRKLAEKTMTATQEVGSSITAIQNSARHNIEEVGSAVSNVTEATELANASGTALNEIVTLAAANSSVVASIATAAEEQSATSEEISRALEEINSVVGETTEGIIQSSSAVQDLSSMAQELRQVMEQLK